MRENRDEEAAVERIDGRLGLDEDASQGIDAAYLDTLIREHGEEKVAEARDRWQQTLRAAGDTVRSRTRS